MQGTQMASYGDYVFHNELVSGEKEEFIYKLLRDQAFVVLQKLNATNSEIRYRLNEPREIYDEETDTYVKGFASSWQVDIGKSV